MPGLVNDPFPVAASAFTLPIPVIDDGILVALDRNPIVVLNISGGKDSLLACSLVMSTLDRLGHPRSRRVAIHADLGAAEWPSTASTVQAQAKALGLPLIVVRREAGDMVDRWIQRYDQGLILYGELRQIRMRGPWSSASSRFCTAELKRDVIHRYLAATYPGETIVSVLGIRRAESAGRATTPISKVDKKLARANGTNGVLWHPLVDVPTDDVYLAIETLNLPMHEAYTTYGSGRLSCAYCVLASKRDLQAAASAPQNTPLFRRLVGIEALTGFSFQQQSWLADIAPHLLDEEMQINIQRAKRYAKERRAIETSISKEFLAHSKAAPWPRRIPTAEEASTIVEARKLSQSWTGHQFSYTTPPAVIDRIASLRSIAKMRSRAEPCISP